jgi:starch phosphorylase
MLAFFPRTLPQGLEPLTDLALDLRWTWSHAGDRLWRTVAPDVWERTENPWIILQDVSEQRLEQLAADSDFTAEVGRLAHERDLYLGGTASFQRQYADTGIRGIAYFSMEFGLGEALPLYAGGLGILAGDYLKAASDLGLPLVGVGLLYQEGYFRQMVDAAGQQLEAYPYNDPISLPIVPVRSHDGGWLHVTLEFPGRNLLLRVWQANVGRVTLYLLDSNDPLNAPVDRGITGKLYGGGQEMRLIQEVVLGIGGWRLLQLLGLEIDVCHLNEGHAAFVVLERARQFMEQQRVGFWEALWATRAGNVFTTHTPVAAGFDRYPAELVDKYMPYLRAYLAGLGISLEELIGLGRKDTNHNHREPFNMAYLAMRGCSRVNGVSRLHGAVSRRIFRDLYPRWPEQEIPVSHVTNGVHVPSWDSPWADHLWSRACGKDRWLGAINELQKAIRALSDEELWTLCASERHDLIRYARERLAKQLGQRGAEPETIAGAEQCLDPNSLTIGFARRFAEYKRPNLLLHDSERLARLLTNPERPVQLIIAGKAHPQDETGKRLVREWFDFVNRPQVRAHAVFLEDYDIALAQELVQGVDLWINTPRRPWEACGTSGMKVLANGGLNLSELDGWWAEAYAPEYGWALGDGREHDEPGWDSTEAEALYMLLENDVVPLFYARDAAGIPRNWVARIRKSMAQLAPRFSCNRMVREYIERFYQPAARAVQRRSADGGRLAKGLYAWQRKLQRHWASLHFGHLQVSRQDRAWQFQVQVYLGDLSTDEVRVELYADACDGEQAVREIMVPGPEIAGAVNGYVYGARVETTRPAGDFTPRILPANEDALAPIETGFIRWQR